MLGQEIYLIAVLTPKMIFSAVRPNSVLFFFQLVQYWLYDIHYIA